MSFADPQSVTIGATPFTLPRVSSGENAGGFKSSDGNLALTMSSTYGKRTRQTIRLQQSKISADPLAPSVNVATNMSVYMVVDRPINGFTVAETKSLVDAFTAYLVATTGARVTQLLGGEN